MGAALRVEGLSKRWPSGGAGLEGASVRVEGGEVVAVLGRSGAGKSTLLRCIARLLEPTEGRVFLGDLELTALRGAALARARGRVGFVFQQFNLVKSYSVLDNVLAGRLSHVSALRGLLGWFPPSEVALAKAQLARVGLEDKEQALARDLSGGQQQRVALARVFAQAPEAILADEPTASLDPRLSEVVLELLRDYSAQREVPVLLNVHSLEHARRFCARALGLRKGRVVFDGPIGALDDAAVERIYGDDP